MPDRPPLDDPIFREPTVPEPSAPPGPVLPKPKPPRDPMRLPPVPGFGRTWCQEGKHGACSAPRQVGCRCECHQAKPVQRQEWNESERRWQ